MLYLVTIPLRLPILLLSVRSPILPELVPGKKFRKRCNSTPHSLDVDYGQNCIHITTDTSNLVIQVGGMAEEREREGEEIVDMFGIWEQLGEGVDPQQEACHHKRNQ